ncbi:MAG: methionyl-tRNA formyltransferase [Chloroflexi bacterium]|nr:methionyl-tRNA formyltransferase [Chloroflexota bacterium]
MLPRIVFMGSPEFALSALQALHDNFTVVGVVTQPDRPSGRGRTLKPPAIKSLSQELGIPLIQPKRLREPDAMQQLQAWRPDVIIVAAYGQILKPAVLDLPLHGCVNMHASLLPRWRGASPIQAAILHGDSETGITIMRMDPGMDTGPILSQRAVLIHSDDTAGTLSPLLSGLGGELLLETLPAYLDGEIPPQPQDDTLATKAPLLKKSDGLLDFTHPADELERQVRAYNPWPGAFMYWKNQPLKIHRSQVVNRPVNTPGKLIIYEKLPAISTSDGLLVLEEVQPAGKKSIPGLTFLNGARGWGE